VSPARADIHERRRLDLQAQLKALETGPAVRAAAAEIPHEARRLLDDWRGCSKGTSPPAGSCCGSCWPVSASCSTRGPRTGSGGTSWGSRRGWTGSWARSSS